MKIVKVTEGDRGRWWYGSGRLRSTTPGFPSRDTAVDDALQAFAGQALRFVDAEGSAFMETERTPCSALGYGFVLGLSVCVAIGAVLALTVLT